jgi:hypothetical protein
MKLYMKIVLEYIPLLSVIILTLLSNDVKNIWFTPLGKVFAIVLIVFYSRIDKYIGLGVCMIIIMFYNTYDFYVFEGLENDDEEGESDEEAENLIEEAENEMNNFDVDEVKEEAVEITGEDIKIQDTSNSISEIQQDVNETKKLELDAEKDKQEHELKQQKIDLEKAQQEKNDNTMSEQMSEQKKRREIETLQNILKERKNYSQHIINKTENRLSELLFNDKPKKESFVSKECMGCANTTLNKIETFANLIPRLTRV